MCNYSVIHTFRWQPLKLPRTVVLPQRHVNVCNPENSGSKTVIPPLGHWFLTYITDILVWATDLSPAILISPLCQWFLNCANDFSTVPLISHLYHWFSSLGHWFATNSSPVPLFFIYVPDFLSVPLIYQLCHWFLTSATDFSSMPQIFHLCHWFFIYAPDFKSVTLISHPYYWFLISAADFSPVPLILLLCPWFLCVPLISHLCHWCLAGKLRNQNRASDIELRFCGTCGITPSLTNTLTSTDFSLKWFVIRHHSELIQSSD